MKLTEMKQILASGQIQLTKSLGQNFLHDQNQLRRIADAAELEKSDQVLEVGPGLGPLTELLLERAGTVLAIEKDRRLVEFLQQRFGDGARPPVRRSLGEGGSLGAATPEQSKALDLKPGNGKTNVAAPGTGALRLLHDDALDYLKRERRDWTDWKLVANLPYSIASPIMVEMAKLPGCPKRMVVTLQLEVARRLVATADDDDYGILSLLIQLRYEPLSHFKIPADCFFPAPDVDSACVVLKRREQPLLPPEQHALFEKLVKLGFSQRRKMMLKLLKQSWPVENLTAAFEQLGLSPQIRAEKVSLEQFVELVKLLT